jgi:hypothetical protein
MQPNLTFVPASRLLDPVWPHLLTCGSNIGYRSSPQPKGPAVKVYDPYGDLQRAGKPGPFYR